MRMERWIFLLGLISIVAVSWASDIVPDVLKCAKCHKAPSLSACSDVAICSLTHEVCYVEQETDWGGETVINAGCRRREHCDGFGCFNEETGTRQKRSLSASVTPDFLNRDITCHHCCDGHFCNMHGCADKYDVSRLPGKRCLNCTHVRDPVHCTSAVNCEHDHDCIIETLTFNGDIKYNLGCRHSRMCDMLDMIHQQQGARKKRDYHVIYSECCRHHMCNGWIPMLTAEPPINSDSYRCPILGYNNTWLAPVATNAPTTTTPKQTTTTSSPPPSTLTPRVTTTPTPAVSTNTAPPCEDLEDCSLYGHDYACSSTYEAWARTQCPKFCGYCGHPTSAPGGSKCEDQEDCSVYGFDYVCSNEYKDIATLKCPKFCGLCTEPTVTEAPCADLDSDCASYGLDYICLNPYRDWASIHCRKFCGMCSVDECKDKIQDCAAYGADYICQGDYIPWAKLNCAKFCNLCPNASTTAALPLTTTVTTAKPAVIARMNKAADNAAEVCEDVDNDCYTYGHDYICVGEMVPWSQIHCRKYCGFCKNPVCEDVDPDCDTYGVGYICTEDFRPWASIHCAKYCYLCDQEKTTTTLMTSTVTTPLPTTERQTTLTTERTSTAVTTNPMLTSEVCEDVDNGCYTYGHDYICVGDMIPWSQIHCRKYCGFCKNPVCEDVDPDCDTYRVGYICTNDFKPWASIHCAKYCNLCDQEKTTATVITSTVTTPVSTVSTNPVCEDVDPDCDTYGVGYICTEEFKPWASIHCAKYCNLCDQVTSTTAAVNTTVLPSTTEVCEDVDNDCYTYGHDYICVGEMVPWSRTHCRKYCGFCKNPVCEDVDPDCDTYGFDYICKEEFKPWSSIHCAKFCNLCEPNATIPSTNNAPKTTTTVTTTTNPTTTTARPTTTTTTRPTTTTSPTTTTTTPTTTTTTPTTTTTTPTTTTTTPTTTTTTPTTTTPTTTTIDPRVACGNKFDGCVGYTEQDCSNPDLQPLLWENCRGHCRMCLDPKPTTTVPTTPSTTTDPKTSCANVYDQCSLYTPEECTAPANDQYMWEQCRGHCGLCLEPKPKPTDCIDEMTNCGAFPKEMICFGGMKDTCKSTCNIC